MKHLLNILLGAFLLMAFISCAKSFSRSRVVLPDVVTIQHLHGGGQLRTINMSSFVALLDALDGSPQVEFEKGIMYRMTMPVYALGDVGDINKNILICDFNSAFYFMNNRYTIDNKVIPIVDGILPENKSTWSK